MILPCVSIHANAIEGSAAAGPIGGTDIRQALIPPPGLYGGVVGVASHLYDFVDGAGATIPPLATARVGGVTGGAFLAYVPDVKIFDGSIALLGVGSAGNKCGHLFAGTGTLCRVGFDDPYFEVDWGRQFGHYRPSQYPGAFPIFEGLAVTFGLGVVAPIGQYDITEAQSFAANHGNNIWDFAPTVAVTYTTPPLLFEGTEFSGKFYWNNYLANPATHYLTGQLFDVDFAVTEHVGRFQFGLTGFYVTQIQDDTVSGLPVAADGGRTTLLYLGGIMAYDMPEYGAVLKAKVITTAIVENNASAQGVVVALIKKLY
jgi:hypothetical protein